jgi:lysozyme
MDIDRLRDELRDDEGFMDYVYYCPTGHATAGYGHNCEAAGYGTAWIDSHKNPGSISRDQAETWLDSDIQTAMQIAQGCCGSFGQLSDARQRVLCNMAFNMGNKLSGFKRMLAAIANQDWHKAAEEMRDSVWAGQVHERSSRLAEMMVVG